ncbi:MAG TPA: nitroreductase family protein [Sphingomonadaceae bacterium]|nr:nitroreductase family protein [Sphingomonadaceae bacterium]
MENAKSSYPTRRKVLIGGGALLAAGVGAAGVSFARMGSADAYASAMRALRAPLAGADPRELVRYATLAANSHNTQPWRFAIRPGEIRIAPDFTRRTPAVDPDDHHLHASLGCAAENLALAAAAAGLPGELSRREDGSAVYSYTPGPQIGSPLFDAIPLRQSTRAPFDGQAVSPADLALLEAAGTLPGAACLLLTDRARIGAVRDLVVAGNTVQANDKAFVRELAEWVRFNPREALEKADGLPSAASGNPAIPTWLGKVIFPYVFTAEAENPKYVEQLDSSAGIAVFVAERADPEHWMIAGRACQRFALQAAALGIKTSFVNQPVEVERYRADLASVIGMPGMRPDLVVRFGRGKPMPMSPRRPVDVVIEL